MATPESSLALSAQDRLLVRKSEEALRDGGELQQWCRGGCPGAAFLPLDLKKTFRLRNKAEGFFGTVEIGGQPRSVMGCHQTVEFARIPGGQPRELLRDFVFGVFLQRACWTNADGSPGGFTIEQGLHKLPGGRIERFSGDQCRGCVDWRELGSQYAWVLLTLYVNDFVMEFGPFRKRLNEALCGVMHPDFIHVAENPSPEYIYEVSIGYPVIDFAPIPNHFGFGPGKFVAAVKLFSFFLTPRNEIRVSMLFAAAPRCQKVFDFGPRWPDPVYGGASLLERLSFGRWDPQPFHDRLDAGMLAQHCRIHQALMDGCEKVWRDWSGSA